MNRALVTIGEAVALVVVLALLWAFPIVLFPHPDTNEAIELSNLELPVSLAGLVALVLVMVFRRRDATVMRVGLGTFLIGVAVDLVIGLVTFGNLQDDRFMPLLFLPLPVALTGVVAVTIGAALSGSRRRDLVTGVAVGLVSAAVVGIWLTARGARDWLLAPYGFDIELVVLAIGTAIVLLTKQVRQAAARG